MNGFLRCMLLYLLFGVFFLALAGCQPVSIPDPIEKLGNWETIEVAPGFFLTNNMWGTEKETRQVIFKHQDGSYAMELGERKNWGKRQLSGSDLRCEAVGARALH